MSKATPSCGNTTFDPDEAILIGPAGRAELSPKQALLLQLLIERAGHTTLYEHVLTSVWPHTVANERNIRELVFAVRGKLRDVGSDCRIRTRPRFGLVWEKTCP